MDAQHKSRYRTIACLAILLLLAQQVGAADMSKHRVLIIYHDADPEFEKDANKMKNAFKDGGIPEDNIVVKKFSKSTPIATLSLAFIEAFEGPGANTDPKIFYYAGHGRQFEDDPVDEDDETAADGKDERMTVIEGRDDSMFTIWSGYTGPKVLIYDQCHAGGMWDGGLDPRPNNAFFMGAVPAGKGTPVVSVFTPMIIAGMSGNADGADGTPKNWEITAKEIKAYLLANPKPGMDPVFDETGSGGGTTVLANALFPPVPPAPGDGTGAKKCESLSGGVGGFQAITFSRPTPSTSWVFLGLVGAVWLVASVIRARKN